jgi:hypothetical protein
MAGVQGAVFRERQSRGKMLAMNRHTFASARKKLKPYRMSCWSRPLSLPGISAAQKRGLRATAHNYARPGISVRRLSAGRRTYTRQQEADGNLGLVNPERHMVFVDDDRAWNKIRLRAWGYDFARRLKPR